MHPPPPQRHTIRSYTDMWPRVYLSTVDALFHACRKRVVSSAFTHTVKRLPSPSLIHCVTGITPNAQGEAVVTIGGGADVEGGSSSAATVGTGVVIVLSAERSTDTDPYDYLHAFTHVVLFMLDDRIVFLWYSSLRATRSPSVLPPASRYPPHFTRLTLTASITPPPRICPHMPITRSQQLRAHSQYPPIATSPHSSP